MKIVMLNHGSLCRCLCIPKTSYNTTDYEKFVSKRARLGYTIGFICIGIICIATRLFPLKMFYFVYNGVYCSEDTYLFPCFTLVILYRVSLSMFLYHFIISLTYCSRNEAMVTIQNMCWTVKALLFVNIFVVTFSLSNNLLYSIAYLSKFLSFFFIILLNIVIYDVLFFYLNKKRNAIKGLFTKCWRKTAYVIAGLSVVAGLGALFYTYYSYYSVCFDYRFVYVTFLLSSIVVLILGLVEFKFSFEIVAPSLWFLYNSVNVYTIIGATPHVSCVNITNRQFFYVFFNRYLDTGLSTLIRLPGHHADPGVFLADRTPGLRADRVEIPVPGLQVDPD